MTNVYLEKIAARLSKKKTKLDQGKDMLDLANQIRTNSRKKKPKTNKGSTGTGRRWARSSIATNKANT